MTLIFGNDLKIHSSFSLCDATLVFSKITDNIKINQGRYVFKTVVKENKKFTNLFFYGV